MPELNRRRFLQLAGGTAAFAAMSNSIEQAAAIPAHRRHGNIKDVEHIVVLMQENRSFDHYFGSLKGVRGFGDPRPVTLPSGKSVFHQTGGGKEVLPFHPEADDLGMQFLQGLAHSWPDGHQAINNGKYDQWVPAKTAPTMAYLTRDDIPFHYALADKFTICDSYHCSFIGATDPTATTCGPGTPATTARAADRCSATTNSATAGPPTRSGSSRPASPGRSTRTSATA